MRMLIRKVKFELKTAFMGFIKPFVESGYRIATSKKRRMLHGKKIAIYTSVFGGYDTLHPITKQSINVDWICFSDRKIEVDGWKCVVKTPISADNRMAAKWFKINPTKVDELNGYDCTIYIDSSAEILSKYFAEIYLSETDVIGFHRHPERNSVLQEAAISSKIVKYQNDNLIAQAKCYIGEMGRDEVLWAGGVIVRNRQTPEFDSVWWEEMNKSLHDQISLPYAAYKTKKNISALPLSLYNHIFIRFNVLHRLHEYKSV